MLGIIINNSNFSFPKALILFMIFGLIVVLSIFVGLAQNNYESILIPIWGLKTSFFYFPILFFLHSSYYGTSEFYSKLANIISKIIPFIVLFGTLQFIFGSSILQTLAYPDKYEIISLQYEGYFGDIRPIGTFRSANDYGMFCLFSFILLFYKYEKYRNRSTLLGFSFAFIGVISSLSKNNIIGLLIFLFFNYLIKNKKYNLMIKFKFVVPVMVFILVTLINMKISSLDFNAIAIGDYDVFEYENSPTSTTAVRLLRWNANLNSFTNFSNMEMLFGSGYGNFGVGRSIGNLLEINNISSDYFTIVDNNYILFLLNLGIFGVLVAFLIVKKYAKLFKMLLISQNEWHIKASFIFFLILISNAFFINVLESFPGQIIIFMVLALPTVYSRHQKNF